MYQVIVKKQMFAETKRMADERKRIADSNDVLRTVTLLFQRNLNCPIATKMLNEHAQAALRRVMEENKQAKAHVAKLEQGEQLIEESKEL